MVGEGDRSMHHKESRGPETAHLPGHRLWAGVVADPTQATYCFQGWLVPCHEGDGLDPRRCRDAEQRWLGSGVNLCEAPQQLCSSRLQFRIKSDWKSRKQAIIVESVLR